MFIKSVKVTREYITNEYNFKKIKNAKHQKNSLDLFFYHAPSF